MTLKLGTRGHKGERDNRDLPIISPDTQDIHAVSQTGSDNPTELGQRTESHSKE